MKQRLDEIISFLKNIENILLILSILLLILLTGSIFVSDFNLLKSFVFINLLITGSILGLLIYLKKHPKEGKPLFTLIQNLLDSLNEGIVIYDDEFKIVFINQAFAKMVNLEENSILNLKIEQSMIKNKSYEMLANLFFPFLAGENLEIISQNPETVKVKFSSPEEKYFLISYLDILLEKRYKLRIILDKTQDVLENQKRLEFVQLVSHNLLTPLSEIRWLLESMDIKNLSRENKEVHQSALNIIQSTLNLTEIMLTMLRAESGRLELRIENVNLEQVFKNILVILEEKIKEKNLKIEVNINNEVKTIPGDNNLVSMLFYALIENAILYNKINGRVLVSVQKFPHRPYAEIIIQDTGIGMSKEDLENLFKKYYRGKKTKEFDVKGFGIGLYTAKTILDLHGSEIKVESVENEGTKITILWPLDVNLIVS